MKKAISIVCLLVIGKTTSFGQHNIPLKLSVPMNLALRQILPNRQISVLKI